MTHGTSLTKLASGPSNQSVWVAPGSANTRARAASKHGTSPRRVSLDPIWAPAMKPKRPAAPLAEQPAHPRTPLLHLSPRTPTMMVILLGPEEKDPTGTRARGARGKTLEPVREPWIGPGSI